MRMFAIVACCPSFALGQASLTGLGHIGSTVSYSEGRGISADGQTGVGGSLISGGIGGLSVAYSWREGSITPIFTPSGGSAGSQGSSADGSLIVGSVDYGSFSPLGAQAFVYSAELGPVMLGDFPSNPTGVPKSFGRAISSDGSTIVGNGLSVNGNEAFVMNLATHQFVGLGALSSTNFSSWAYGVSGNGSVVVGSSYSGATELQAFRWTPSGGIQGLGFLPSPAALTRYGQAEAVSADGQVIVGQCRSNNSQNGLEAFRWSKGTGMVGLGDLSGGSFQSFAFATNSNGSVIVGRATIDGPIGPFGGGSASRAFIWDATYGMRDLQLALQAAGAIVTGWNLQEARGVSADGRTIVGTGIGPDGATQGWIAVLPVEAPPTCYANCDGSTLAPVLTANDFICFMTRYAGQSPYANCDGSTLAPVLSANDFQCFMNQYAAGCP